MSDSMHILHFKSRKIAASIPLDRPAAFFTMQKASSWKEFIVIQGPHLETILKKKCTFQRAYLFEFGCVTFVGFEEPEIQIFLEFIAGMVESIDYSMAAIYAESHMIKVDPQSGQFHPWEDSDVTFLYHESAIALVASILAKSAALNQIEAGVDTNIDESGKYLDYLNHGRLRIRNKAIAALISRFLKLEYESINHIRIFDRSVADVHSLNDRELYDALAEYYELHERYNVLENKIETLRSTVKSYNSLSYRQNENRLLVFEIFLLALFPIASVVHMFLLK